MNAFDTMRQAINDAKEVNRAADSMANSMATILEGRLKHVSSWTLKSLKRELRDFNIHTGHWKEWNPPNRSQR